MQPTLSSVPGALVLRTLSTIILISILIAVFFGYTADLEDKAEALARDKVIRELNTLLSFHLYQSTISGKLDDLQLIHLGNPFVVLAGQNYSVPVDYKGELTIGKRPSKRGWYFDSMKKDIFYWDNGIFLRRHQLRFTYNDSNGSGRFEASQETIKSFQMVEQ